MAFFRPLEIHTERLLLRPLRLDDAAALFPMWSDVEAMRYFSFAPMTALEQARERVARVMKSSEAGKDCMCVIETRADGAVVGDCALFRLDEPCRRAEIGFSQHRRYWGHGYMTEAVGALVAQAFDGFGLRRLEADIDPRNAASARLLERLGFVREGLLRERWSVGGEISDSALYGLLERDRRSAARGGGHHA